MNNRLAWLTEVALESAFNLIGGASVLLFCAVNPRASIFSLPIIFDMAILLADKLNLLERPFVRNFREIWLGPQVAPYQTNQEISPSIDFAELMNTVAQGKYATLLTKLGIDSAILPAQILCPITLSVIEGVPAKLRNHKQHWFNEKLLRAWVTIHHENPISREKINTDDILLDVIHGFKIEVFMSYLQINQTKFANLSREEQEDLFKNFYEILDKTFYDLSEEKKSKSLMSSQLHFNTKLTKSINFNQHLFSVCHKKLQQHPEYTQKIRTFIESHDNCYKLLDLPINSNIELIQKKYAAVKKQKSHESKIILLKACDILLSPEKKFAHDLLLNHGVHSKLRIK